MLIYSLELFERGMRIDLCGRHALVSKQPFYAFYIGIVIEQRRCIAVTKHVG